MEILVYRKYGLEQDKLEKDLKSKNDSIRLLVLFFFTLALSIQGKLSVIIPIGIAVSVLLLIKTKNKRFAKGSLKYAGTIMFRREGDYLIVDSQNEEYRPNKNTLSTFPVYETYKILMKDIISVTYKNKEQRLEVYYKTAEVTVSEFDRETMNIGELIEVQTRPNKTINFRLSRNEIDLGEFIKNTGLNVTFLPNI